MDGPINKQKKLAIIIYLILCCISIYATAESIASSFIKIPILYAYIITIGIFGCISYMLIFIKDGFNERNFLKIIASIFLFFIGWIVILSTNTHKFFTLLKLDDIRNEEISKAANSLENMYQIPTSIGNKVIIDFDSEANNLITKFYDEMTNDERPCFAEEASKIKSKVDKILKTSTDINRFLKRYPKTRTGCRSAANEIIKDMQSTLTSKKAAMATKLNEILKCGDKIKITEIIQVLKECKELRNPNTDSECRNYLDLAHQNYQQIYECTNNILINNLGIEKNKIPSMELEIPVPSIHLEKISALLPYVFRKDKDGIATNERHKSSFWLCFVLAILIDLGAFMILYNKILINEE